MTIRAMTIRATTIRYYLGMSLFTGVGALVPYVPGKHEELGSAWWRRAAAPHTDVGSKYLRGHTDALFCLGRWYRLGGIVMALYSYGPYTGGTGWEV